MCESTRAICIYPSSVLSELCREAGFSEPIYSEICEQRFMFEFTVKFRRDGCSSSGEFDDIEGNGYPFRDKADAFESGALSALENLLYVHGIGSSQYNDIVFCESWPLFKHLSENVKATKGAVMRLLDDLCSLCKFLDDSRLSFQTRKTELSNGSHYSDEIVMLDECESVLLGIHDTLLLNAQQYRDNFRLHCRPNRPDHHDYYAGSYSVKKEMDMKVKCNSTLKLTLNKLCEATCYSVGAISCDRISEGSYQAKLTVVNPYDPDRYKHLEISSGECSTISEAEDIVIYRTISFVCKNEGYKIIDPGYNDLGDMERDSHSLRYEIPTLCEMLVKLKNIVQCGFSRLDNLGQKYYRELRRHLLLSELRIVLADCIGEFAYICKSVDGEVGKVETYHGNLPMRCSMSGMM
ncbi:unnamed protein product [Urochloa humidicola]